MNEDMLKIAYQQGFEIALEEAGMTKEALLGRVLLNAGKYLGKTLWGAGKLVGKGAWKGGKGLYSGAKAIVPGGGGTLSYGLFGGGLGALGAEPGHRLEGFGKGFGAGLIGGMGWHYGSKATQGALRSLAKSKMLTGKVPGLASRMTQVMGKAGLPETGMTFRGILANQGLGAAESAKLLGTKALTSGAGLAAAFGLSGAAEDAANKYIPALRQEEAARSYRDIPRYVSVARDVLRAPRMGLTPPGGFRGSYSGTTSGSRTIW